jgi:hypothetical protein
MYSFIVLGIIPGTNISISFSAWLGLVGLVMVVVLRPRLARSQSVSMRQVLPASRLHRRIN